MKKFKLNEPLSVGDIVVCVKMVDDYGQDPGMKGTVTKVVNVMGDTIYEVKWNDGSRLSLIDGVDTWVKFNPKNITEIKKKDFLKQIYL